MPRQSPYTILLSNEELEYLETVSRQYTAPYFEVIRAKIVLDAARGLDNQAIAAHLDLPRQVVSKWRQRFFHRRLAGLQDDPRAGRPPGFSPSHRRAGQGARVRAPR